MKTTSSVKHLAKSPLYLSLSLILGTLLSTAYAAPNANVIKLAERNNSSPATMCVTLDKNLKVVNKFENLNQFISLAQNSNTIPHQSSIDQGQLCLSGLQPGQSYELTLKKGLALSNGNTLNEDVIVPFSISDAPAQIRLPYNIVLPSNDLEQQFSIDTINEPAIKVEIYKLPVNSFNQLNLNNLLTNEINQYSLSHLLNNYARKIYGKIFILGNDVSHLQDNPKAKENAEQLLKAKTLDLTPNTNLRLKDLPQLSAEQKNQVIKTQIELKDFAQDQNDGIFIMIASDLRIDTQNQQSFNDYIYSDNKSNLPLSAKLLMITDLGLTTYKSDDGILVNLRSLKTAKNLKNVSVQLIARNNEVLATTETDKNGFALFKKEFTQGKNALEPVSIIARKDNDIYSFDLRSTPLYLENNTGIKNDSAYEVYAYTDRGIYRENETVHYLALVRDQSLKAVDLPLTIKVKNQAGLEIEKKLLEHGISGGYNFDFNIPVGTRHGSYRIELALGDQVLSQTKFNVGSYIAKQINSSILNTDSLITVGSPYKLQSQNNFNYGGAAANLNGLMEVTLIPDPHPVVTNKKQLSSFHFGPDARTYSKLTDRESFYDLTTNVEGVLQKDVTFKSRSFPQEAIIKSTVYEPNGQSVSASKKFKLAYNRPLIGVKQLKDLADSGKVAFALCSYLQDGSTFPQDVNYYVYKERNDYNFVYENNNWHYVRFTSRTLVNQGKVKVDNQDLEKALVALDLEDGNYVLEVQSDKSKTTYQFYKGFLGSDSATTPDLLDLFTDKEYYQIGDKVKLSFDSPFEGYANLIVGSKGISEYQTFDVKQGHNEIEIEVTDKLHPQGHVLLSIYSPLNNNKVNSVRAVGLTDLKLDLSDNQLPLVAEVASEIKPDSKLEVNLALQQNQAQGEKKVEEQPSLADANGSLGYAKVTLVDNGILALTNYNAPNPNAYFEKDRAYDVSLYDSYGYLMTDPQQQGQGYGPSSDMMLGAANLNSSTLSNMPYQKNIALASEIVPLDANGKAKVTFDIPQFSGSLKVMAVAWNDQATGSANSDVLVKDNTVVTLGVPRFLNVGDSIEGRLNLHNLKNKNPDFKVDITCTGALSCSLQTVNSLKPGVRSDLWFDLKAAEAGLGNIVVKVQNDGYTFKQSYPLEVTYTHLPMLKNYFSWLEPGQSTTLKLADTFKKIDNVVVAKSNLPNVNPTAYVQKVADFGTGTVADLVASLQSKLLYGKNLILPATVDPLEDPEQASKYPYKSEQELNNDIYSLIARISAYANSDGSFGTPFNYEQYQYTNIYASDVLLQAYDAGFTLNENLLDNIISNLRLRLSSLDYQNYAAYANEILARYESVNTAALRYSADNNKIVAPIMLAHLSNVLRATGDLSRADAMIDKAITGLLTWQQLEDKLAQAKTKQEIAQIVSEIAPLNAVSATDLRHDSFIVLDSLIKAGQTDKVIALINKLRVLQENADYLSPLTMAAMLQANHDVGAQQEVDLSSGYLTQAAIEKLMVAKPQETPKKEAQGKEQDPKLEVPTLALDYQGPLGEEFIGKDGILAKNEGKIPVFVNTSVLGISEHDDVISNNGVKVRVNYFNRDGQLNVDKYKFRMNEEVLVEVFFSKSVETSSNTILKLKKVAGFEFVRQATKDDPTFGKLLKSVDNISSPRTFEAGDDLIVATYDSYQGRSDAPISLYLVLRATAPGTYQQGEALMQLESAPQVYGTYIDSAKIKIVRDNK